MKSIVLYYSRTGKTAVAAKAIADKISSEIVEIKDLKGRKGFMGYIKAALDARSMKTTPIEPSTVNIADYDTICLGTPIWAGKPAPAINTIIKNSEIQGKNVIILVTLGGNGYEDTLNSMSKEIEAKGGNVIKTIAIAKSGNKTETDIANEINNITI
ncbi:flavodoxin family protein [Methanobacterium sp.]|uniref:flavodoxin family protein n=1 Tax=Methanobacterium sp. TaxID=2164 RepID=UPI003C76CF59